MKTKEYVYDLRPQIDNSKELSSETTELYKLLGIDLNRFSFEDSHHYNVPKHSLKVGHLLYAHHWNSNSYFKAVLIHKYHGVHFFKWLEGPSKDKVETVDEGSLFFMKMIYPIKIIVPEGIQMEVVCPHTEVLNEYDGEAITTEREKTGI